MSRAWPFVSIVIPVFRDWDRLEKCIDAIEGQSYPSDSFEVIVVNNHPEADGSVSSERIGVRLIDEPNPGSYSARNAGVRVAKGDFIAFTDADCVPDSNWLVEAINCLQEKGDLFQVGGRIAVRVANGQSGLAEVYEKVYSFPQELILSGRPYSFTANLVVNRKVFDDGYFFDQKLFSGGDAEWGRRVSAKGYKLGYCPSAIVFHPARATLGALFRKQLRVSGGQYDLAPAFVDRVLVVVIGFIPPLHLISDLRGRSDLSASDKVKGFSVLYFLRVWRSMAFVLFALVKRKPRS